ncbi:MAG: protein BatD [Candidatus Cloacimonetes bacterium]|nr:protein BatD [Candidatus Cloacimonadota bacterium]
MSMTLRQIRTFLRLPLVLLVLLALAQGTALAATFNSEVSLDGGTVLVRYVLSSESSLPHDVQPQFPDFKGFRKLSGPAISRSTSIVNGAASYERSWSFSLLPDGPGTRGIGMARVTVDGKTLTAPARTINISDQPGSQVPAMLRAEVSNRRPVVGEKVLLRYKLYYNVQVSGYDIEDLPSSAGFLRENLEDIQRPESQTEMVDGQSWNVAVIKEIALFPTRDGNLEIPALNARVNIPDNRQRQRQRSLFDNMLGGDPFRRVRTEILPCRAITLDVQPLPPGAPAGFTGVVGQYRLDSKPDRTALEAGEALTLTTRVSGEGNLALLPLLEPEVSRGLEKYDTQQESSVRRAQGSFGGTRSYKTLIVARDSGEQTVGAIQLVYYDPVDGSYKTLSAGPWTLDVAPGTRSMVDSQIGYGLRAGKVESYGQDIRHILDAPETLSPATLPLHRHWSWRTLVGLCLLAPLGASAWMRRQRLDASDPLSSRRRRAGGEAGRRLAAARKALARGDATRTLKELDDALARYLADRLGRPPGELVLEELAIELLASGRLSEEAAGALTRFRRELDLARYASDGAGQVDQARALLARGDALLKQLRTVLEGGKA